MAEDAAAAATAPDVAVVVVASAVPAGLLTPSGVGTPGDQMTTGTVTPALSELPPDQVEHSLKVSLADLCAKAAVLYSQQKNYEEAADVYARAAEIQAEMNGETDPENAEILFLYGRALFKVGQSKSDVLGGKAADNSATAKGETGATDKNKAADATPIASAIAAGPSGSGSKAVAKEQDAAKLDEAKKPLFQFTGDEEWDASDEEGAAEGEDDENEEEEDDLAVAFEVLDLSRVLFEKQLAKKQDTEPVEVSSKTKGKEAEMSEEADDESDKTAQISPSTRHTMERLADTHDLLAEISLENERYPNAIMDSRASLAYKQKFLPEESEIIAEAHFKLSLALEFASVTTSDDKDGGENGADKAAEKKDQQVDQELRDEAARELQAAISSTKLKLQNKEVELATVHAPEDNESTRRQITEVKEIIADMEQRLIDLKKPPMDLSEAVNGPAAAAVGGLISALGSASGAAVEEAKKGAKDLTNLVRRKAKDDASPATANGNGAKRKADESADGEDETKKVRTDKA